MIEVRGCLGRHAPGDGVDPSCGSLSCLDPDWWLVRVS